jgi:predicted oxidoreductase
MERGLKSVQFDSDAWLAELDTIEHARAEAATRLLLAYAPQAAADPASAPLAMVRQIVLDAAYQLK